MQSVVSDTHSLATGVLNLQQRNAADAPQTNALAHYQIIRRNCAVVPFEPAKIAVAMMKAFLAVHGTQGAASASVRETVDALTQQVVRALVRSRPGGGTFHIEDVQDHVELGLMRGGHHEIARAYVLYRERRTQERAKQSAQSAPAAPTLFVVEAGQRVALDVAALAQRIEAACAGLGADVKAAPIMAETLRNLYDGVPMDEVYKAAILAARTLIEKDPDYTYATARLLFHTISREILGRDVAQGDMAQAYADYFPGFIKKGVDNELLDEKLLQFDLKRLGAALKPERDLSFDYLGLQTLYDRYFLHVGKQRIELPQAFFMRVAMGLSLNEIDRETRAIEFYEVLSSFDFMSSTPTLFNSGTLRSQLSSCYLTMCPTTWTAFTSPSRKTRCSPSLQAAWATTGHGCARWAPISRAPMANRKALCPSLRRSTTPQWRSTKVASARARSAPIWKPGTSTSKNSWSCARTPATTAAAPTT
jgi:ribonucleoside-diphosphate reductase alpha chain